jgi:hypothetical protein
VSEEVATIPITVSPRPKLTSERKKEYALRCATRIITEHSIVERCTADRTVQERIQETQSGLSCRYELKEYNNDWKLGFPVMQERELTSSFKSGITEANRGEEHEVPATMPNWLSARMILVLEKEGKKRGTHYDVIVSPCAETSGKPWLPAAAVEPAILRDGAKAVEPCEVGCDVLGLVVEGGEVVREA